MIRTSIYIKKTLLETLKEAAEKIDVTKDQMISPPLTPPNRGS